jgi:NAD(P)-dependent dehydrogenase (short-subunit alcohol dehydrogenase family)
MQNFVGQRVLVTGAAGGIGSAIAHAFAQSGAHVILSDVDATSLHRKCEMLVAAGHTASAQIADLATREGARDLAARCGRIDILINAAALTSIEFGPVIHRNDAYWDRTLGIGLLAPIALMQELVPGMVQRGRGSVVNISSMNGSRGSPHAAPYSVTKSALEMVSKVAAMELAGHGVQVNCIAPGIVGTEALTRTFGGPEARDSVARQLVPLGRVTTPEEVASLCLFLASDQAASMIGAVVALDGGVTAGSYSLASIAESK